MVSETRETFNSVAVIGAAGKIGGFFTETLSRVPDIKIDPVLRGGIGSALEREPEAVILATPNPTEAALKEIAEGIKTSEKSLTLVLVQNGVDVIPTAERVLKDSRNQIRIVRASLYPTVVSEGEKLVYDYDNLRIGLALVPQGWRITHSDDEALEKAESLFRQANFDVKVMDDYQSMEWTKLVAANLQGSTSTLTEEEPRKALRRPEIYAMEYRGLRDRLAILSKANIKLADLWGIGKLRWFARLGWIGNVPGPVGEAFRGIVADKFARERNNQPPAAAQQIKEGVRKVEATQFYHRPFTRLAEKHGLESPVDEAIRDTLLRHEKGEDEGAFDLNALSLEERKKLLLDTFALETEEVFVRKASFLGIPYLRLGLERIYEWYADKFEVSGSENLVPALATLRNRQSVLVAPNHRSHADHTTVIKALRESLPFGTIWRYPIYVVAGMKFDKEDISGRFSRAYAHPVVWTLTEEDNEEAKWKAQIINRRAGKVIEKLLSKPCIFVVYLEGGRNKSKDLKLQEPAPHSSWWVLKPQFGLIIPTAITGTEIMLPPGEQKPHHANVTVEFCEGINSKELRSEKRNKEPEEWDRYFSGEKVLSKLAAKLPEDQRRVFK